MCGPCTPPPKAPEGESRHGFTVGDRVEVTEDQFFRGWHGHVRAFSDNGVAVDLDEPPSSNLPNGQWFGPEKLQKAPLNIIIMNRGCYYMQFLLQHKPYKGQQIALRDNGSCLVSSGVHEITNVVTPPMYLSSKFHWVVELQKVRNLCEKDQPILVGKYY